MRSAEELSADLQDRDRIIDNLREDVRRAEHRRDQAAASLGAKVAEVAKLERELAIARAAIPATVTCSGCDLVVLVSSLCWGTRATHYGRHGEPCGHWTKDGKPWVLDCPHPSDAAEAAARAAGCPPGCANMARPYCHCQRCGETGERLCADGYCRDHCGEDCGHGADVVDEKAEVGE